jgi:hypothetical protein
MITVSSDEGNMQTTGQNIKERFVEAIRHRAVDDRYIDQNEEREIVQIALEVGMSRDAAHAELAQVCSENGYILETDIARVLRKRLDDVVGRDGMIHSRGFHTLFTVAQEMAGGRQSDRHLKRLVLTVIEDEPTVRIHSRWPWNWHKSLRRELGLL